MKLLIIPVLIICTIKCTAHKNLENNLQSLVTSERAFAEMSAQKGISPSFTTYFHDCFFWYSIMLKKSDLDQGLWSAHWDSPVDQSRE